MNTKTCFVGLMGSRPTRLIFAAGLPVLAALSLIAAQRGGAPMARPAAVSRASHGSVRHAETHVVARPAEVRREPARPAEVRREPARPAEVRPAPGRAVAVGREGPHSGGLPVRRDWEADVHAHRFWHDFAFHRRLGVLPVGFFTLAIGGVPYYYCDGIYYQPADGQYEEVYPPVGAAIPELPDGAIPVEVGGTTYYYAGGAFYVVQPDGSFSLVPPPIGAIVPELPPGAGQVSVPEGVAYQFNGTYYEPVFANGVTQYQVFTP